MGTFATLSQGILDGIAVVGKVLNAFAFDPDFLLLRIIAFAGLGFGLLAAIVGVVRSGGG